MEEIEKLRKSLGPLADGYTDAQVRQLDYELKTMAELLLDIYLDKTSASEECRGKRFDDTAS